MSTHKPNAPATSGKTRRTPPPPGKVTFIGSFPGELPAANLPEVAFAGRSNVGKSSAINGVLGRKKAARVSRSPGRTQAINLFEVNGRFMLADLPGYGFAKVPDEVQRQWKGMVEGYLGGRDTLRLVVVLVAVLNKQVTTDELFTRGIQVFALTAILSLFALLWRNDQPIKLPSMGTALPEMAAKTRPLLPYMGIGIAVLVFYRLVLDTSVNEHTAAMVLPAVLLALLVYDRATALPTDAEPNPMTLGPAVRSATSESSDHIGALLMVMVGSVGLGGVVERAEVMALVPESFGSTFVTMVVLVIIMVVVGMTMDALGAVVLVSVTVAQIAYANGIDAVHFWMMVLCAFELGYLTPPVALNHLLARQVIGPACYVEEVDPKDNFFEAYEHLILPMMIMGTALLIVAFVPLLFY